MDTLNTNALLQRTAELESELAAKNRELEIEASLEKVRARTMAMQRSDELSETAAVLFQQLKQLGEAPERAFIGIFNEEEHVIELWPTQHGGMQLNMMSKPSIEEPFVMKPMYEAWKQQKRNVIINLQGKELEEYFLYVKKIGVPVDRKAFGERRIDYVAFFSKGMLGIITQKPRPEETLQILERFATVFDLTFTRFLDLQKAEAQAREAQIEAALERVRTVAMSMKKPDDLLAACEVIYNELHKLGFDELRNAMINIYNDVEQELLNYDHSEDGGSKLNKVPYDSHPIVKKYIDEAKQAGDDFTQTIIESEAMEDWKNYLETHGEGIGSKLKTATALYYYHYSFETGVISISNFQPISATHLNILKRFRNVFNLSYQRYIDITIAEAQAREATIETALEKIRSRSLAMNHSDELKDVIAIILEKSNGLKVLLGTVGIWLFNKATKDSVFWLGTNLQQPTLVNLPYDEELMKEDSNYKDSWEAFLSGKSYINKEYSEEEKNRYFRYVLAHNDSTIIPPEVRDFLTKGKRYVACLLVEQNSTLLFDSWNGQHYGEESIQVLRRVAKVFEQAYIRFLDLQKAEAQAREARIEAALEKVRSRSLAMHKSEELQEVVAVVFEKLLSLEFSMNDGAAVIMTFLKDSKDHIQWIADETQAFATPFKVPYSEHSLSRDISNAKESGADFFSKLYPFEEKNIYFKYLFEHAKDYKALPDEVKEMLLQSRDYGLSIAFQNNSAICIPTNTGKLVSEDEKEVLKRFAKVFEQSYIRFLDLQKAEAQAREAQIELGLERVRAKAMAMQNSNELAELVDTVFKELTKLHFILDRCLITIIDERSKVASYWMANPEVNKTPISYRVPLDENSYMKAAFAAWKERKLKWVYDLKGEEKSETVKYIFSKTELRFLPEEAKRGMAETTRILLNSSFNNFGSLQADTIEPLSEENFDILYRFAKVFDLTYTRFNDLKQAEAQAREAQIQLALERIRSRSLAMHHSNELKEVVGILFQQLRILGLEFDGGAAITLFSENSKDAVILVAAPDLASPTQIMLPYDAEAFVNNPIILDLWHAKETRENIFNRFYSFEEKNKYFRYVFKHNGLEILPQTSRDFILQADSYTASFIAEKHSLLGANSWTRQQFSENDFEILKRITKVFEQAYIRFLDLQKAEALAVRAERDLIEIKAARKKAEETLIELKATQAQLIQSEKMASLGELTAGIAHEIQNPLNFVNNFAEVNNELIEEMNNETDLDEMKAIANDIKQNNEKIGFHGKRADSIVKGMMQHSQLNVGQKEPTDINALTDEYLRLSFHGIRAKDKSFNATIETDFDNAAGKINVVPQDIGRVLLNLYNNAFYAVNEKNKTADEAYQPTVAIQTKRINGKIEITVGDNGNGIPQNITDKIFQPFFTTKPTGQGTGLGLSLSYDIIKAHGGEIKVETREGEGSEFVIRLPNN